MTGLACSDSGLATFFGTSSNVALGAHALQRMGSQCTEELEEAVHQFHRRQGLWVGGGLHKSPLPPSLSPEHPPPPPPATVMSCDRSPVTRGRSVAEYPLLHGPLPQVTTPAFRALESAALHWEVWYQPPQHTRFRCPLPVPEKGSVSARAGDQRK